MTTPQQVSAKTLLAGFNAAYARFMESGRMSTEPADAFLPIFEALSWAASLDHRLGVDLSATRRRDWNWHAKFPQSDVLLGVRYARNAVHHQWSDALYLTPGAQLPALLPAPLFEWRWQQQLPTARDRRGRQEYEALLAGAPARMTLETLQTLFTGAVP
jgi:hypothetical protein